MTTALGTTTLRHPGDGAHSLIAALRARADEIRREELARLEGRWDGFGPADLRLESLTRGIVEALLREPTARLRAEAGHPDIESARFLFALDALDDAAA
ncbi:MAG: hypothetical protein AB7V62_08345 [Thermoleophilia bacterium]